MARAYIGLGANLGDPAAQVQAALDVMAQHPQIALKERSGLYRSAPLGPPGQPDYCNAACAVETGLSPQALMAELLAIERAAGRERGGERWGPRVLDLDLLHFEGVTLNEPGLHLPHPQVAKRNFVLAPLAEIAPALEIPGVGRVAQAAVAIGHAGLRPWSD